MTESGVHLQTGSPGTPLRTAVHLLLIPHEPALSHLNTSRAWPLSGDVSLKNGTTRDRLALRRDAPVPPALSATPPTKPPARVSAVVCFFRNFSRGFIPAGMVGVWAEEVAVLGGWMRWEGAAATSPAPRVAAGR